jgi:5-methylcytosine-specific restriction endonuclease McrA
MSRRDPRRLFTSYQSRQLVLAADYRCERCRCSLEATPFHIHHVKRHADGGRTELYNAQVLCTACHKEVSQ